MRNLIVECVEYDERLWEAGSVCDGKIMCLQRK